MLNASFLLRLKFCTRVCILFKDSAKYLTLNVQILQQNLTMKRLRGDEIKVSVLIVTNYDYQQISFFHLCNHMLCPVALVLLGSLKFKLDNLFKVEYTDNDKSI